MFGILDDEFASTRLLFAIAITNQQDAVARPKGHRVAGPPCAGGVSAVMIDVAAGG